MTTDAAQPGAPAGQFAPEVLAQLFAYLEHEVDAPVATDVLRRGGQSGTLADMRRRVSWWSYDECRTLLEGAAAVIGRDGLIAAGGYPQHGLSDGLSTWTGPADLLQASLGAWRRYHSAHSVAGEPDGPDGWVVRQHFFDDRFPPFRAFCAFTLGYYRQLPGFFGFDAEVRETECQCDGAPACVFTLHWYDGGVQTRYRFLAAQVGGLQTRLEALRQTVALLVSVHEPADVLPRILQAAAQSVTAPAYALVLDGGTPWDGEHGTGLSPDDLARVAREIGADGVPGTGSAVVAPVASATCNYGLLFAYDPNAAPFYVRDKVALEACSRMVAVALDAATSLLAAQRQSRIAAALLQLAGRLAESSAPADVADELVRATPRVLGCDRVLLTFSEAGTERVAGSHGWPSAEEDALARWRASDGGERGCSSVERRLAIEALLRGPGIEAVAVREIVADGEVLGHLAVGLGRDAVRLSRGSSLDEVLHGLAGQAATALRNARLLERIRHQATHDALTGLPNRTLVLDRLQEVASVAAADGLSGAVFYVDLDGFKTVNDTHGHALGDELLRVVAARLSRVVRDGDVIGRIGGDEFVMVAESVTEEEARALADRVLAVFDEPVALGGQLVLHMSASVGVALCDVGDALELLRRADVALYQAKAAGKSRAVFAPGHSGASAG